MKSSKIDMLTNLLSWNQLITQEEAETIKLAVEQLAHSDRSEETYNNQYLAQKLLEELEISCGCDGCHCGEEGCGEDCKCDGEHE